MIYLPTLPVTQIEKKRFVSPYEVAAPQGAEGWQELYPYFLTFRDDRRAQEEGRFWFCDSQHWPAVFRPFDTIGVEFAIKCLGQYNTIDILINNAAIYAGLERRPFWELDEAEWDRVLGVNLKGAWLCAKAVFPAMRRRGRGKIINVASATVFSGSPLWAHYVASKGGVIALTRTMAREAGDYGITVNALAPGFTLTNASLGLTEDAANYGVNRGAIKRPAYAEDMVGAAIFLASPASDFMTGQTLIVDGGRQFI